MRSSITVRTWFLISACGLAAVALVAMRPLPAYLPDTKIVSAAAPAPVPAPAPESNACADAHADKSTFNQVYVDDFGYGHVVTPLVAVCFAPGTDPAYMKQVYDDIQLANLPGQRFNLTGRWPAGTNGGDGQPGSPQLLRWSLVPDGTPNVTLSNGTNPVASNLFAQMDAAFAAQGGRATWIARLQSCFDRWQSLTGLTYDRVILANDADDGASLHTTPGAAGLRGDVRIAMRLIDGSSNVLAFNFFPPDGDMTLDSGDLNFFSAANNNHVFLRDVVMHEHGHGIGLLHVCPIGLTRLMEPFIDTTFDGPQHDDIRAAHTHYGDKFEQNDSIAQATNLGTLTFGSPVTIGTPPAPAVNSGATLSIDAADNATGDFFKFTVTQAVSATISAIPQGFTYDSSQQACGGSDGCCSGNPINSLAMANLNVQVIAPNGTTILANGNASPAGAAETVSNVNLLGAGTYFIKVFAASAIAATNTQLYLLNISLTNLDCNSNGIPDPTDIANHTSLDCNADGVPDECQVPPLCTNQLCPDCNSDGIPDNCQVPPICTGPGCPDCNGNGVPDGCEPDCNSNGRADSCDITLGSSQDCQPDAIPDECQVPPICTAGGCPDCNHNLIPDLCEFISGALTDCNSDSIADTCQTDPLLCGGSGPPCITDCDQNHVPDVCQTVGAFSQQSPNLSPVSFSTPQAYTLTTPPAASGDITLTFRCTADIDGGSETISVNVNGTPVGDIFEATELACPSINTDTLTVPAATWNTAVGTGNAIINMVPNVLVDPTCPGSFISVKVEYSAAAGDCNGNGQLDACEIASGTAFDCNVNGKPDDCDIFEGILHDADLDNRPDECACNAFCPGDLDLDVVVDGRDIGLFLACLASGNLAANDCGCADMNGDLKLNAADRALFVSKLLTDPNTDCP